ncbi:protein of unknown function [Paraburkholderia kururiensis]
MESGENVPLYERQRILEMKKKAVISSCWPGTPRGGTSSPPLTGRCANPSFEENLFAT